MAVTNDGERASDEAVQLYIHDLVGSVTRPLQELKGLRRVAVAPGESSRVEFSVGRAELSLFR